MACVEIRVSTVFPGNAVTRPAGTQLAEIVADSLREGRQVLLDWKGIEVVSSPFAQGFLGTLLAEFPWESLKGNVRHRNLEGLARESFKWAAALILTHAI